MLKILICVVLAGILCACSTTGTQYTDPNTLDTTTIQFGSSDLQMSSKKLVDNLLSDQRIAKKFNKERPIIFFNAINNETDEHINTKNLANMVSTHLLQSGRFRFADMGAVKTIKKQLGYQHNMGLVNPKTAVKIGKQLGAQLMLYGSISNITKKNSDMTSVYFLITLKLMNLKTGIVIWADQKQIRKTKERALFGL